MAIGGGGDGGGGGGGGRRGDEGVEHARAPTPSPPPPPPCVLAGWKEVEVEAWWAVLPVAIGHGIVTLLLLEELCDGQKLL